MDERGRIDALELIGGALKQEQRERRAHFGPALLLTGIVTVASLVIYEVRPDLLDQPTGQLVLQALSWVLCLFVLPAIGVGLLFPGRFTRLVLIVIAIGGTIAATTGWPFVDAHVQHELDHGGGCLTLVGGAGVLLLAVGFVSGAFVQRRSVAGVFWVASGLALVALNLVTWHCPESGLMHVLPAHVGAAALLLLIACVAGLIARRGRGCC